MKSALIVFLGAGLGGVARHGVNTGALRVLGPGYPWATLAINIAGSTLMGMVVGWLALRADAQWSQGLRLFLTTGILGGFTTFSAFSLDAVLLWQRGEHTAAASYVAASVALSLAGLVAGLSLMRALS